MFRQTVLLVCLIAFATSASAWFGVGLREEGDQNIFNQTAQTLETEFPTNHTINLLFDAGESTFTHSRFEIEPDWDSVTVSGGIENGFNVTFTTYNTTQIFAHATIYGFPPGQGPVDFKPRKITSNKTFTKN